MRSILPSFGAGDRELSRRITRMIWGRHHVLLATVLAVWVWISDRYLEHHLRFLFRAGTRVDAIGGSPGFVVHWIVDRFDIPLVSLLDMILPSICAAFVYRRFLRSDLYRTHLLSVPQGRGTVLWVMGRNLALLAIYAVLVGFLLDCIGLMSFGPEWELYLPNLEITPFALTAFGEGSLDQVSGDSIPPWRAWLAFWLAVQISHPLQPFGELLEKAAQLFVLCFPLVAVRRAQAFSPMALVLCILSCLLALVKDVVIQTRTSSAAGVGYLVFDLHELIRAITSLFLLLATLYWWHRKVRSGPLDIESQE